MRRFFKNGYKSMNTVLFQRVNIIMIVKKMLKFCQVVNKELALMKQKMSVTKVACNLTYGQIQVLSDHIFHLLETLA
jgi:hypothetical protein